MGCGSSVQANAPAPGPAASQPSRAQPTAEQAIATEPHGASGVLHAAARGVSPPDKGGQLPAVSFALTLQAAKEFASNGTLPPGMASRPESRANAALAVQTDGADQASPGPSNLASPAVLAALKSPAQRVIKMSLPNAGSMGAMSWAGSGQLRTSAGVLAPATTKRTSKQVMTRTSLVRRAAGASDAGAKQPSISGTTVVAYGAQTSMASNVSYSAGGAKPPSMSGTVSISGGGAQLPIAIRSSGGGGPPNRTVTGESRTSPGTIDWEASRLTGSTMSGEDPRRMTLKTIHSMDERTTMDSTLSVDDTRNTLGTIDFGDAARNTGNSEKRISTKSSQYSERPTLERGVVEWDEERHTVVERRSPPAAVKPPIAPVLQLLKQPAEPTLLQKASMAKRPTMPARSGSQVLRSVAECGVRMGWLREWAEQVVAPKLGADTTTGEVCMKLVVEATRSQSCRYVDTMDAKDVGQPTFFISHAWGWRFASLVSVLGQRVYSDNTYVWIDIFAINQHPHDGKYEDLEQLAWVITQVDKTLFCLDEKGSALTRIWCLFEIWQTVKARPEGLEILSYAMPELDDLFKTMDVREAKATVEADRVRILHEIAADIGHTGLNLLIKAALVDSAKREALQAMSAIPPNIEHAANQCSKAFAIAYAAGQYQVAFEMAKASQGARERTLGPDHPLTLSSVNHLGQCMRAMGHADQALPLFQRVLKFRERALGREHADTLLSQNHLAQCLKALGHADEALPLFQRTLEARERTLGRLHPETLVSVNSLAQCLKALGHADQALPLYERELEASERTLGPEHPETLVSVNSLAQCMKAMGHADAALPLFQRALEARERTLGPDHPHTLASLNSVAQCLEAMGRASEALPLYQRAVKASEATLGREHPETLVSVNDLAQCQKALGHADQALPLFQRALEARERTLGPEHPSTLVSVNSLAQCLEALERLEEALPLYQRDLEASTRTLGVEHPDTLVSMNSLAQCYRSLGHSDQALPLLRRALEACERTLGYEHPNTLVCVNGLAQCLDALDRGGEALPLYQRDLEASERTLGPDHPDTLISLNNLAQSLEAHGRTDEALPLYERAVRVSERVLGKSHPTTEVFQSNLENCMQMLGYA